MVCEDSKHFSALSRTPVKIDRPLVSDFYTAITAAATGDAGERLPPQPMPDVDVSVATAAWCESPAAMCVSQVTVESEELSSPTRLGVVPNGGRAPFDAPMADARPAIHVHEFGWDVRRGGVCIIASDAKAKAACGARHGGLVLPPPRQHEPAVGRSSAASENISSPSIMWKAWMPGLERCVIAGDECPLSSSMFSAAELWTVAHV